MKDKWIKDHFLNYEIDNQGSAQKKQFIRELFDSIAATYDLSNHVLSFGLDIFWRKHIFKYISIERDTWAVDLCSGTGDLSLLLYQYGAKTVSIDFSLNMLKRGRGKQAILGYSIASDVSRLPFAANIFSVATIAFGIRNLPDIDNFIREVNRVLVQGGRLVILELVRPVNILIKAIYYFYLKIILPFIGGLISGRFLAYKYLSKTIRSFIDPVTLQGILEKYGFTQISHHPQSFGIAAIIIAEKRVDQ
jgi:demethylmenaquinone methyltransferase/2-methoxy-6-polyprenyl-1,4-benzoquinol methylase